MNAAEFCQQWFPLVVTCDGEKFPVEWFNTQGCPRGVARIAGKFVVSVYPEWGGVLREPAKPADAYRRAVAHRWTGLWGEVIEHGVGSIDKSLFSFDKCFQSKLLIGRVEQSDPAVAGTTLSKLFDGMAVIERDCYGLPAEGLPEFFWHVYEPRHIHELLVPMARYIAHWL